MVEYKLTIPAYVPETLDAELRAALGDRYAGMSGYGVEQPVSVWLVDVPDNPTKNRIEAVGRAHKATPLPAEEDITTRIATLEDRVDKLEQGKP